VSKYDLSRPVEMSVTAKSKLRMRRAGPIQADRPPKRIDKKKLIAMASMSLTQRECAALLGCSVDTLQRNYSEEYELGKLKCSASVRRKQFEMGMAGNVTALIWMGKNLCGQKDRFEATGADDGPLFQPVDRGDIIERIIRQVEAPAETIQ